MYDDFVLVLTLLRTSRFPVLFVFGKAPIDIDDSFQKFQETFTPESKAVIFYECRYQHAIKTFQEQVEEKNYVSTRVTIMNTESKGHEGLIERRKEGCGDCGCGQAPKERAETTEDDSSKKECCSTPTSCLKPEAPATTVEESPNFDFCGRRLSTPLDIIEGGYSIFYIGEEEDEEVTLMLMAFHQVSVS